MTDVNDYGPGVRWLAERAGVPPEELLASPSLLIKALGSAVRDTADLAEDALAPDPEVRRSARERADELTDRLTTDITPGERFASAIHKLLHPTNENKL